MIRTLLLSTVAAVALVGTASAADLPVRTAAPAPVYAAPMFTWTGFYVGLQAGYAWGETKHSFSNGAPSDSSKPDGFLGGIHAGYNQQFGAFVAGLEADADLNGAKGSYQNITGIGSAGSSRLAWQGSLRGRLGFAADRTLFYVTGGWAFADAKFRGGPALPVVDGYSKSLSGWTLGAGIEHALSSNWTVRGEYRYTDFGKASGGLVPAFAGVIMDTKTTQHAVRLGLTYKFGGPSAIVAKY